jgi:sRNA-binding protein
MVLVHPTASGSSRLTCESHTWENRDVAHTKKSEVLIDRRSPKDRRKSDGRRKENVPAVAEHRKSERRKVPRRRQIDPTTCERNYSADEVEFMQALDAYKRANGRMFPTCSEILEVIRDMGYVRLPAGTNADPAPLTAVTLDA